MRSRSIASLALVALLLLPVASAHAALLYQWTWTGDCVTGCVGQATWDILETLPGSPVFPGPADVTQAIYQDNVLTLDFRARALLTGIWEVVLSVDGSSGLTDTETFSFVSSPGGAWRVSADAQAVGATVPCGPVGPCLYFATGQNGVWVQGGPIPWPATLLLLLGGVSLLSLSAVKVANALRRLLGRRSLGFRFTLRGLCTLTH